MNLPFEQCNNCPALRCCDIFTIGHHVANENKRRALNPNVCTLGKRIEYSLNYSRLPKQYKNINVQNHRIENNNQFIMQRLNPIIKNIEQAVERGTNFLFSGGIGTGKTHHGALLVNHFIYKDTNGGRGIFGSSTALFVVFPELMDDLRYRRDDKNLNFLLSSIMDIPLLLLDDVGASTMSDFVREQTYLIINHRYNNKLSTIITSNLDMENLANENKLGARIVSRLAENVVAIEFLGYDLRFQR